FYIAWSRSRSLTHWVIFSARFVRPRSRGAAGSARRHDEDRNHGSIGFCWQAPDAAVGVRGPRAGFAGPRCGPTRSKCRSSSPSALKVGLSDPAALAQAFAGCDAVAHCAGINREIGSQTFQRVHIEGTRNLVEAVRGAGVRKIALMSFLRARPNCGSAYHESKWSAE